MALLTLADRVAETTTTTGTGTLSLGGAVDGKFRTFVAGAGSGNTVPYVMVHRTANEWEVGYGVVTAGSPDTLTRAGVYSSSSGGSAVTFSAGTKDVFLGLPAGKTVTFDDTTGAVTIASLTVSGDLTVDTSTLKVDSVNNRVGIGTASPASGFSLDVASGKALVDNQLQLGTSTAFLSNSDNAGVFWANSISGLTSGSLVLQARSSDTGSIAFVTGSTSATERARIDASGNFIVDTNTLYVDAVNNRVGVGTASPITTLNVVSSAIIDPLVLQANGTSAYTNYRVLNANSTAALSLGVGGSAVGATVLQNNAYVWNTGNSALSFGTNDTERARITAGGYLKASNDGTYFGVSDAYHEMRAGGLALPAVAITQTNATGGDGVYLQFTAAAPDNNTRYFLHCLDNVASRLFIYSDGDVLNHDGVYGTISDAKLKQDITDAESQWDDIKAIRFRKYRFKSDVEQKGDAAPYLLGVVAQELREVSPGLVDAHPDTEQVEVEIEVEKVRPVLDAEGQPVLGEDGEPLTEAYTEVETRTETRLTGTETLSVKQSVLLMKAAKALQEAMARIETLEARVAALEAK